MKRAFTLLLALVATGVGTAWGDPAADRAALITAIQQVVDQPPLSRSRVGVQVSSLETGKVVYARNAEDLLNPASNVKLFTTAAALMRLGPEYRFTTQFFVDKQPDPPPGRSAPSRLSNVRGPLYVRGGGDPTMNNEKLWGLVNDLYFAGLRTVSGDLVLDDSWFDAEMVGPGFDQESSDKAYMAPTGALSLNWNAIGIYVTPGDAPGQKVKVDLDPESDYFVIENRAMTRARGLRRLYLSSVPFGDKQKIVVTGNIPLAHRPTAVWRKIDNPSFYFGYTLKKYLALRGIKLRGKVRRGTVPTEAQSYLTYQSETLDLVLKRVNKLSSNFMAEQLVKTLGAQVHGAPGSWPKGIRVIEDFLASEVGIPLGTYVMKNGSGLNDTNRFSADQTCRLLRYMWQRVPYAPEYLSSLTIAGKDGTLHYRMEDTEAAGRLRAKTGTLENVAALSGYLESVGGERFVISIVANDFPGRARSVVGSIDAISVAVAAYGAGEGPSKAVARLAEPSSVLGPLTDMATRIATYEGLAQKGDPRNLTFLRTALRSERDPALRAVVADAAYRSAPEDHTAIQAVVEHFASTPEVLGRLREVAREKPQPTPVLGSLIRIAGEGDPDALSRLVEVAAFAKNDAALASELREPLIEVSRNAPQELIEALYAAPELTREAALDLFARSLASASEPGHPFPALIKSGGGSADPDLAAFVRALEENLAARLATEKESQAPAPELGAPTSPPAKSDASALPQGG